MTRRIFRYEVPVDDQPHSFVLTTMPMSVGCRDPRIVEFWAINNDADEGRSRTFIVVGTGHPLPERIRGQWGTAVAPGGQLVWHLIEVES
jgi:hypothetical protein